MPKRRFRRKKSLRRRCDARIPRRTVAEDRALRAGKLEEYLRRTRCRNWAMRGSKRCRLHGGLSTGPTTPEGMARTVAALKAGRARWLAGLKAEGKPIPCGRKKGGRNLPKGEREHAAYVEQCHRDARKYRWQARAEQKARRAQQRQEREEARRKMEEHAWRKARADAGFGYYTPEEWEKL
jgi:hypothetical protein